MILPSSCFVLLFLLDFSFGTQCCSSRFSSFFTLLLSVLEGVCVCVFLLIFISIFGCAGPVATHRLSLVALSRSYSLVAVHGLLYGGFSRGQSTGSRRKLQYLQLWASRAQA